jgi:pyruvate dehydrogenase E1 component
MRGFLLGATAGRTTLAGEGLQHQDGQSHVYSLAFPNCVSYDPAYAYELAVIIRDGIRRMYRDQESIFYYLTVMNEQYEMPPMPEGSREGILKGMYRFSKAANGKAKAKAQLLGSGTILNEVRGAAGLLEKYGVAADVWSVTSYNELYREAHACDRWNMLNPGETPKVPYVTQALADTQGVIVAASDYLKVLPASIDRWMPRRVRALGTDGFGRSEARKELREFFEVESRYIALATLAELAQNGAVDQKVVAQAMKDFGIDPKKKNPAKD